MDTQSLFRTRAGSVGALLVEGDLLHESELDREIVNSTPDLAHLSRATDAIFLVCTWLKFWSPALDRIVGL